jgi:hypothetical protein
MTAGGRSGIIGLERILLELEDCCGLVLVSCCCEKLVAEAREHFGNPEERERPPLKAATGNG